MVITLLCCKSNRKDNTGEASWSLQCTITLVDPHSPRLALFLETPKHDNQKIVYTNYAHGDIKLKIPI